MIDDYQYHQQFQNTLEPEPEPYISLADAILLGAAITEPKPYDLDHCALGMAANAVGIDKARVQTVSLFRPFIGEVVMLQHYPRPYRSDQIMRRWPWLNYMRKGGAFNRSSISNPAQPDTNWNWIADAFNLCVCPEQGEPTMTLEELCAEVRRMEAKYVPELAAHAKSPIDTAPITYETAIATSGVNCS